MDDRAWRKMAGWLGLAAALLGLTLGLGGLAGGGSALAEDAPSAPAKPAAMAAEGARAPAEAEKDEIGRAHV